MQTKQHIAHYVVELFENQFQGTWKCKMCAQGRYADCTCYHVRHNISGHLYWILWARIFQFIKVDAGTIIGWRETKAWIRNLDSKPIARTERMNIDQE